MDHSSGEFFLTDFVMTLISRPGFRDSAFQPFKREEDGGEGKVEARTEEQQECNEDSKCNEAEDSEGDEMVDIERIEDKEEDPATTSQT